MNNQEFKNLLIQRSYKLAKQIIALVDKFPQKRSSWVITDQLLRAGTSIGANIIEAQAASSKKDFTNFINHSLKSANETKFWLELSKDLSNNLTEEVDDLLAETTELANILGKSILSLRSKF